MTLAICMNCGEEKFGALVRCACGFAPVTGLDIAWSLAHSDHFQTEDILRNISAHILACNNREARAKFDFFVADTLQNFINNPTKRDIYTLVRNARKGAFRDEINVHLIGPNGYKSSVSKCGSDIDMRNCISARRDGLNDIFFAYTLESGAEKISELDKKGWYLLKDQMILLDRRYGENGAHVKSLDILYSIIIETVISDQDWDLRSVMAKIGLI